MKYKIYLRSVLYEIQIYELLHKSTLRPNTRHQIRFRDVNSFVSPEILHLFMNQPTHNCYEGNLNVIKFSEFDTMIQSILFYFSLNLKRKNISLIHYNRCVMCIVYCVMYMIWFIVLSVSCFVVKIIYRFYIDWLVGQWLDSKYEYLSQQQQQKWCKKIFAW